MAYGIKVTDGAGRVTLDTSSVAFNLVDSFSVPAGGAITKSYPSLTGYTLSVTASPAGVFRTDAVPTPHSIVVSGQTVTVSGGNIAQQILVLAR